MRQYRYCHIILFLLLALPAIGGEKTYTTGRLSNVAMEDMSFQMTFDKMSLPVSLGTMYRFDITSGDITYVAACFSRNKRAYAADWIVHDPVAFRIEKDRLFLKRSNGKELRLAVLTKVRNSDGSDESASSQSPQLKPSKTTVPECR